MYCKYCNEKFKNEGSLKSHETSCEKVSKIKDEIIDLYMNEFLSIHKIREKFSIGGDTVRKILGDNKRTLSEANSLSRKLHPYNHTEESKQKMREKRLEYMKNNPDKTAWRQSNQSYPEKLMENKFKELKWDKKFRIIKEYSVFPYFVDFAFENEKIAFEVDGSQHLLPEYVERDKEKEKLLIENGWFVFRATENEVKTNINNIIFEIETIIYDRPTDCDKKSVGIFKYQSNGYEKKKRKRCGMTESEIKGHIKQRKVERPEYNKLLELIELNGYDGTGRLFGVNGNTVKKWLRWYERMKKDTICSCGNIKHKDSEQCIECGHDVQRKVKERPTLEQLELDVKENGYCATGRKYDVSDNCIRKWIKQYKK